MTTPQNFSGQIMAASRYMNSNSATPPIKMDCMAISYNLPQKSA